MTKRETKSEQVAPETAPLSGRLAVYVRLSETEYRSLASDAYMFGKGMPDMLRDGYFRGGGKMTVLMTKADQRMVVAALSRIGNNVNQIARRVNGGSFQAAESELRGVQEELALLNTFARGLNAPVTAQRGGSAHADG